MASKKKEMRNPLQEALSMLKEATTEEYVGILKDEWNEMLERGREPIIEFDNGDYYYIEPDWDNKKFYAGHAFNAGIMREVEIPMEPNMNLDEHIAELFDTIVDLDPSLLVDDDWNDPDAEVEFVNIGEDIDADSEDNYFEGNYEEVIQDLMSRFNLDRETAEKWYEDYVTVKNWLDTHDDTEITVEAMRKSNKVRRSKRLKEAAKWGDGESRDAKEKAPQGSQNAVKSGYDSDAQAVAYKNCDALVKALGEKVGNSGVNWAGRNKEDSSKSDATLLCYGITDKNTDKSELQKKLEKAGCKNIKFKEEGTRWAPYGVFVFNFSSSKNESFKSRKGRRLREDEETPDEIKEEKLWGKLLSVFTGWGHFASSIDNARRYIHHQGNIPTTINKNEAHNIETYLLYLYTETEKNMNKYDELYSKMFPEE